MYLIGLMSLGISWTYPEYLFQIEWDRMRLFIINMVSLTLEPSILIDVLHQALWSVFFLDTEKEYRYDYDRFYIQFFSKLSG